MHSLDAQFEVWRDENVARIPEVIRKPEGGFSNYRVTPLIVIIDAPGRFQSWHCVRILFGENVAFR
jgi:hypothetical protein